MRTGIQEGIILAVTPFNRDAFRATVQFPREEGDQGFLVTGYSEEMLLSYAAFGGMEKVRRDWRVRRIIRFQENKSGSTICPHAGKYGFWAHVKSVTLRGELPWEEYMKLVKENASFEARELFKGMSYKRSVLEDQVERLTGYIYSTNVTFKKKDNSWVADVLERESGETWEDLPVFNGNIQRKLDQGRIDPVLTNVITHLHLLPEQETGGERQRFRMVLSGVIFQQMYW